jgi:DinB superfamily
MKSILFASCLFVVVAFSSAQQILPANIYDKSMLTAEQRVFATNYLQKTKQEFLKSIENLTEEQLTFKAKKGKWCILDCAEHIALAEQTLASVVQKQLKIPTDSLKTPKLKMTEKKIITRLTFRLVKVKAPEVIKPSGKFANIEAIKSAFFNPQRQCHRLR